MELTKKYKEKLRNQKTCKVTIRLNYKTYLECLEIIEKKNINLSQYIRQLVVNDLKHPSYDVSDIPIIGELSKLWSK